MNTVHASLYHIIYVLDSLQMPFIMEDMHLILYRQHVSCKLCLYFCTASLHYANLTLVTAYQILSKYQVCILFVIHVITGGWVLTPG